MLHPFIFEYFDKIKKKKEKKEMNTKGRKREVNKRKGKEYKNEFYVSYT